VYDRRMGPLWERMNEQPRLATTMLAASVVPKSVGVYAWYRDGEPIYAGRALGAKGLQQRVWSKHMATGPDLSRSSFRRNVCSYLGIADTSITKVRPTRLTAAQVEPVNAWIRECEIAWIVFDAVEEAKNFERTLLDEWMPPLSRR